MDDLKATRLSLVNLIINQFLLKMELEPENYTFKDFFLYYTKSNNIEIKFNIPYIEGKYFLGLTAKSPYSLAIFLNKRVYKRCLCFSACHEIIHCLFDMNTLLPTQTFFNVDDREGFYSDEEIAVEKLADCGAGVIMLPDIKLVKYLGTNKSFAQISDECQMSHPALHNRLMDFGRYSCGMSEQAALKSTLELRYQGSRVGFRFYLTGNHLNCEKQIVLIYENAI
ncbi:ImmA/IrrE family metallo-endopeptidase [Enterococcus sp. AZ163]|uniref:ImmA/IrrE family metallo-endopeptidase n=1 Tax=Enterococcus sp. AZ163 TaxID=2774638 RepID=UPI003D2E81D6